MESVDLESFITEAWPRIKPFLMMDSGVFKPPAPEAEEIEEVNPEEHGDQHDENAEGDEEAEDHEEEEEEEETPEKEETHTEPVKYDADTQFLVDQANEARNEFNNAEKSIKDIQNEIKNIEEYFEKDFGPDEEFASLQGHCFEYTDYEYIYKLCPFEKVTQQPKSGSIDTRLGTWARWSGPEDNKYEVMFYDRGQSCWNGPTRSATIKLSCGGENKITAVSEPNRCEYLFDFTTPAACRDLASEHSEDVHDEL